MHAPRKPGFAARADALKSSRKVIARPPRPMTTPCKAPARTKRPIAMRRYQVKALLEDGTLRQREHIGPALPGFETAFSAFAHGTLICTPHGQIAVEDLVPGDLVQTADHGAQEVVWTGSMMLMPRSAALPREALMTRVMADSFGLGRPGRDLVMGPAARILQRGPGDDPVLAPANLAIDGLTAVEVAPPRPVTVHHLCLRRHGVINAGGLGSESYHPGTARDLNMSDRLLDLFLSFFPHIDGIEDFGPLAHPRRAYATPGSEPA